MNRTKGMIMTGIIAFTIGLILVIIHNMENLMDFMIVIAGILFLVPSMYSLLSMFFAKEPISYFRITTGLITSLGAIFMGVYLMVLPEVFVGLLSYMFMVLVVFGGLFHFYILVKYVKKIKFPVWFYVLPLLMVVAGLITVFTSIRTNESIVVLITGISFMAFAVNSFMELWVMKSVAKGNLQEKCINE